MDIVDLCSKEISKVAFRRTDPGAGISDKQITCYRIGA